MQLRDDESRTGLIFAASALSNEVQPNEKVIVKNFINQGSDIIPYVPIG
jgi:hypothetical protein